MYHLEITRLYVQLLRFRSSKVEIFAGSNSIQVRPLISGC